MRFTTTSGAIYDLYKVEDQHYISRDCEVPVIDYASGGDLPEIHATRVVFDRPPTVGERFSYVAASHGHCLSTPVVSIDA